MSRIRTNLITNRMANGAPTVSNGLVISGVTTSTTFHGDGSALTGLSGVSVANQSDNRLITTTGTTDALNGEANLTFDGNILTATQGNSAIGAIIKNTAHDSELQILATYALSLIHI